MTLPDWKLERALLGELPEVSRAQLESDADTSARVRELERSNQEILAALPAPQVAAEVERRVRVAQQVAAAPRWSVGFRWATPMVAIAAVVLAVVVLRDTDTPLGSQQEGVRVKGDARLIVHRKADDRSEAVRPGEFVRAGERVQLSYLAGGGGYGVIISVDGRGAVTVHLPERGSAAVALEPGPLPLPHSYELDDAPEFERFFLVTAEQPFDLAVVDAAAHSLAGDVRKARVRPLPVPDQFAQTSFLVRKGESR